MKLKYTNQSKYHVYIPILAMLMLLSLQLNSFADIKSMDSLISDPDYHMSWTSNSFTTVTNKLSFVAPEWNDDFTELTIGNTSSNQVKSFALILYYNTENPSWPNVTLSSGTYKIDIITPGDQEEHDGLGGSSVTYEWTITPQPAQEILTFSSNPADNNDFVRMEFATKCIPEPSTLALIGLAGGGVLFIRRYLLY